MKNSILMGALVLTIALLPSFASATNTDYAVNIGMTKNYLVPGTLSVTPTLSEDTGDAEISQSIFLGTQWSIDVHCFDNSPANCAGRIVS